MIYILIMVYGCQPGDKCMAGAEVYFTQAECISAIDGLDAYAQAECKEFKLD